MKKTLVAMSGGVDSAVAALLTVQSGAAALGATMQLLPDGDTQTACCTEQDIADARAVADALGIEHRLYRFTDSFREKVIDDFIAAYEQGRTPNPCIRCNRYLKFEALWRTARECGCERVATGHYARIRFDAGRGRWLLCKGKEEAKDQSYVLYSLSQEQLSRTCFPVGEYSKDEVRRLAAAAGFANAGKADSQDICFVKGCTYTDFIERTTGKTYPVGNFVDTAGNILGTHKGIIYYTVGQRKGLGVAFGEPMYVKELRPESNTVVLARDAELYVSEVHVGACNWIAVADVTAPVRCLAKIRYKQKEAPATLYPEEGGVCVVFDTPVRAPARGQAAVFYDAEENDVVLGGGEIL